MLMPTRLVLGSASQTWANTQESGFSMLLAYCCSLGICITDRVSVNAQDRAFQLSWQHKQGTTECSRQGFTVAYCTNV